MFIERQHEVNFALKAMLEASARTAAGRLAAFLAASLAYPAGIAGGLRHVVVQLPTTPVDVAHGLAVGGVLPQKLN